MRMLELALRIDFNELFDRDYYLNRYADVRQAAIDPVFHYLLFGAAEGRQPHPAFDGLYYTRRYPDLGRSSWNPLLHYLKFGRAEGRSAHPPAQTYRGSIDLADFSLYVADCDNLELNKFSRSVAMLAAGTGKVSRSRRVSFSKDGPPVVLPEDIACVSGWCFYDAGVLPSRIIFTDGSCSVEAFLNQPREDAAAGLKHRGALNSGFVLRIPVHGAAQSGELRAYHPDGSYAVVSRIKVPAKRPRVRPQHGALRTYADFVAEELETFRHTEADIDELQVKPLISVLVPTYNANVYYLTECIESVFAQRYPAWELCIADDCSDNVDAQKYLESLHSNSRVRLVRRQQRGHISAASNSALSVASGEFVTFLDHDDKLHPEALLEIARAINANRNVRFMYTDEDKIDNEGRRSEPSFKPPFDWDLLRSYQYLGHLICIERELVNQAGGFDEKLTGAQDWDLVIRCIENLSRAQLLHIPRPLYHWRKHSQSTALTVDCKPYVRAAWQRVVQRHVARSGIQAAVEPGLFDGSIRIRRATEASRVAVVFTAQSGDSVVALHKQVQNIAISFFKAEPDGRVIEWGIGEEDRDAAAARIEATDVCVFITRPSDRVNHMFYEELISEIQRPDCGVVTPVIVNSDQYIIEAGLVFDANRKLHNPFAGMKLDETGYMGLSKVRHRVSVCSSICFAVKSSDIQRSDFAAFAEDPEGFAVQLSAAVASSGRLCLVTPYAIVTLAERLSHSERAYPDRPGALAAAGNSERFFEPLLNPNLTKFEDANSICREGLK